MKLTLNLSRSLNYKLKRLLLIASIMPVLAFAQAWPTKQPIKLVAEVALQASLALLPWCPHPPMVIRLQ
jgi:hypothetical protein